ncbi:hypothetical protein [Pasteurella sp. PK-2025]|uniref:hypothetical protein n=1 Tax=Pasteurella sp. PK-2025 TaxID=3413133 RepID=UPI003C7197D0
MEIKLTSTQARWKNSFLEFLRSQDRPQSMQDFINKRPQLSRIDVSSMEKIVIYLEQEGLIKIERRLAKVCLFKCSVVKECKEKVKKENFEMTKKTEKTITEKTPEELEAMAQELLKLSEVKKKELASGDHIRKTLNPLILQVCQAKGKVDRLIEQQIDALDELDKAVNNLKNALK